MDPDRKSESKAGLIKAEHPRGLARQIFICLKDHFIQIGRYVQVLCGKFSCAAFGKNAREQIKNRSVIVSVVDQVLRIGHVIRKADNVFPINQFYAFRNIFRLRRVIASQRIKTDCELIYPVRHFRVFGDNNGLDARLLQYL